MLTAKNKKGLNWNLSEDTSDILMISCITDNLNWTERKRKMVSLSMTQTARLMIHIMNRHTGKHNWCVLLFLLLFHFLESEIPAVSFLKTLNSLICGKEIKTAHWCQSKGTKPSTWYVELLLTAKQYLLVTIVSSTCYSSACIPVSLRSMQDSFDNYSKSARLPFLKICFPFCCNYSSAWCDASKLLQHATKNVLLTLVFWQNIKLPIKSTTHDSPITNFKYKAVHADES